VAIVERSRVLPFAVIDPRGRELAGHHRGHGFQALAAGSLAGLHRLVDLFIGNDGHLLQVAQQRLELVHRRRLCLVGQ
jgi:hypothetical protein